MTNRQSEFGEIILWGRSLTTARGDFDRGDCLMKNAAWHSFRSSHQAALILPGIDAAKKRVLLR